MPIEILSGDEAYAVRRRNARGRWPKPGAAGTPLYPFTLPRFEAPFQIQKTDKIFCIGSCFAREVEAILSRFGFDVLSKLEQEELVQGGGGAMNRYTVHAMRDEIERVFAGAPEPDFPDRSPTEKEVAQTFRRLTEASVVVITLGLSEAWYDKVLGCYLNQAPPKAVIMEQKQRFELHVLDVDETARALEAMLDSFRRHLRPGFRVLLTVSPVPLHSTFRDQDIVTANCYSKAVLRCAAELAAKKYDEVVYFPSFEMVTMSDYRAVFGDADYRHVDRDFVSLIMSHALTALIPAQAPAFAREAERARARLEHKLDASTATPAASRWRELESALLRRVLSSRQLRKYERGRTTFFEDSPSRLVRWLGKLAP
jgi:hypothetical protein